MTPKHSPATYADFVERKSHLDSRDGFKPIWLPDWLFDFQASLTEWAIEQGRSALYADCGLGKTPMQLVVAENWVRKENRPVLVLTPLGVSAQTVREANKFGIEAHQTREGKVFSGINVTNYERLHYFNPNDFCGVVCDESSAIKAMKGSRRKEVTDFMRKARYRLLCTATAAPNDYIEFGTSSEALGHMGNMDMLGTFFKSDEDSLHTRYFDSKWRFKAHSETAFWRWVCSWARAIRKPSDIGFADADFILPPLELIETVVENRRALSNSLFVLPAVTLSEQREERRSTLEERCAMVAEKLDHDRAAVAWCQLNAEGDLLTQMIKGARQVCGSDSDDYKEATLLGFASGEFTKLVSKPEIAGFGLNWQHCAHMTFFPSHSFERFYQAVRRCYRFGQKQIVIVDMITTEGELGVLKNLQRKSDAADKMFAELVHHMNNALGINRSSTFATAAEVPSWL